jgi:DnaJ-like protein
MKKFDEEIARRIKEAADSGELSSAESYGKPLPEDPGWEATPEALRMPMKILKDAGPLLRRSRGSTSGHGLKHRLSAGWTRTSEGSCSFS